MRLVISCIWIFWLLVLTSNAEAGEQWYQIELVVFSQQVPSTELFDQLESEIEWPARVAGLTRQSFFLNDLKRSPVPYARIKSQDKMLHGSYAAIKNNFMYQPLLHVSWLQAVGDNRISTAVELKSADGTLNGLVRIQRGYYLQLLVDMEYQPLQIDSYTEMPNPEQYIYHLKEKRRIKLNEVHYLDHPKFGIIAKVKPFYVN